MLTYVCKREAEYAAPQAVFIVGCRIKWLPRFSPSLSLSRFSALCEFTQLKFARTHSCRNYFISYRNYIIRRIAMFAVRLSSERATTGAFADESITLIRLGKKEKKNSDN